MSGQIRDCSVGGQKQPSACLARGRRFTCIYQQVPARLLSPFYRWKTKSSRAR